MTEQPFDDDEAVSVATSLEEAANALDTGDVELPPELIEGLSRYAKHVIHVLNNSEQPDDADLEELMLRTIVDIGLASFILGATANDPEEQIERVDEQVFDIELPGSLVIAALRTTEGVPVRLYIGG